MVHGHLNYYLISYSCAQCSVKVFKYIQWDITITSIVVSTVIISVYLNITCVILGV